MFMNAEFTFPILANPGGDMSRIQKKRSVSIVSLLSIGVFALSLCGTHVWWAADPDSQHIQAGAEKGSIQQEMELANAYLVGRGVARDEKQSAYWYEKAANSGDPIPGADRLVLSGRLRREAGFLPHRSVVRARCG